MATTLMMNSNREELHKLINDGPPQQCPRESEITSQILDTEHRVDPKITGNIELVGA